MHKPLRIVLIVAVGAGLILSDAFVLAAQKKENELVVGIFPRRNAKSTVHAFTPLSDHLAKRLQRKVRLDVSSDFETFWKKVKATHYDLVHYNQYHYVRSHRKLGYSVIAMNEEFGHPVIRSVITVRTDSDIRHLRDLKGRKVIFGGGRKAMMSYIMPTFLLMQAGLRRGDYSEQFAKSPPNSVLGVFFKQADAAGTGEAAPQFPMVKEKNEPVNFRYLAISEPLAQLPWAVKSDIPPQLKRQIQKILLELADSEEGRLILKKAQLTGFSKAADSDYNRHRKIIYQVLGERY